MLGNGSLICSNCSYNCKQCGKKIDDLAILTGDKAYCSNCFKCRVCKLKIEDLRYARTSKGLFCMSCHEDLVAKKKKYDMKKKQKEKLLLLLRPAVHPSETASQSIGNSSSDKTNVTSPPHNTIVNSPANNTNVNSPANNISSIHYNTPAHKSTNALSNLNSPMLDISATSSISTFAEPNAFATNNLSQSSAISGPNHSSGSTTINHDTTINRSTTRSPSAEKFVEKYADKLSVSSLLSSATKSLPPKPKPLPKDSNTTIPSLAASVHSPDTPFSLSPAPVLSVPVLSAPPLLQPAPSLSTLSSSQSPFIGLPELSSVNTYTSSNFLSEASKSPSIQGLNYERLENLNSLRKARERLESKFDELAVNHHNEAILDLIDSFSEPTTPTSTTVAATAMKNELVQKSERTTTLASGSLDPTLPILSVSPRTATTSIPDNTYSNKNILLISPNQFNDTEFHSASLVQLQSLQVNDDKFRPRSTVSSPMAKVNRQARVVETNDETSSSKTDSDSFYLQSALTTPKKAQSSVSHSITSPPPVLALPQVPTTPGFRELHSPAMSERTNIYEPKGLGLKGMELAKEAHVIKEGAPAVTNLEDTIIDDFADQDKTFRLKNTRRKLLLRHKRSVSSGLTTGSLTNRLGFLKQKDDPDKGHSRHVLEGSINGLAFTTPPLPFSSPFRHSVYKELQSRATGDTNFLKEADLDFNVNTLKAEINSLDNRRQALLSDNMRLNSDRTRLKETLISLEQKVSSEVEKLESVRSEIAKQTLTLQRLREANESWQERNKQLEALNVTKSRDNARLETPYPQLVSNRSSQYYDINSENLDNLNALDAVSEDGTETQKATRLKFWRRQKVSLTQAGANSLSLVGNPSNSSGAGGYHGTGNNVSAITSSTKMSLSYSSNSLHPTTQSNQSETSDNSGGFKSFNSLITKSRSTNLLDSFVNSLGNGNANGDVPLFTSSIQRRAAFEGQKVPLIVTKCLEEVEKRGMDVEGIYRLSGGNSAVVAIENAFSAISFQTDRKQLNKVTELLSGDINAVTSALKRYLRKIPDPLIPFALYSSFTKVGQSRSETSERCQELVSKVILRLPAANKHTLYLIGKHLDKVNYYSSVNRMNFKNLSVVFAPTIARDPTGEREIMDMGCRNDATELLFANFNTVFSNYTE